MHLDDIKKHWEKLAKEFGTDLMATTKNQTIKRLEIDTIYRAIKKTPFYNNDGYYKVLEVGCGNGYNCFLLSELLPTFHFTGIDYVSRMIENAKKIKSDNLTKYQQTTFQTGDILDLENNRSIDDTYHIVFTDRCIINLNTMDAQLKAADQLSKKVEQNGYLLILENFKQSYERQQDCRIAAGLSKRVPDAYNLFIDGAVFIPHVKKSMDLICVDDFGSLHDLLLYILLPMIHNGNIMYNHPLVQAVADFSINLAKKNKYDTNFGSFGQNRLLIFHKTARNKTTS